MAIKRKAATKRSTTKKSTTKKAAPKKATRKKKTTTAKKSIPLDSEHLRSAASKKGWVTRRKNAAKKKK